MPKISFFKNAIFYRKFAGCENRLRMSGALFNPPKVIDPGHSSQNCNTAFCPTWSQWVVADCSATCGRGTSRRTRICLFSSAGTLCV